MAGDLDGAIASFRTATTLAPADERLWSGLGGLYLAAGRRDDARRAFERSLSLRPNYAALSNFGSLRYEDRDYAGAADLYRRALAVDPRDFRLWGNLGDALAAVPAPKADVAASYADAERRAVRYTSIRADDAQAWALLGWYRANLGQRDAARDALARAEALGSEPAEVAFLGAQALALLGQTDAARARLDRARAGGIPTRRLLASPVLRPLLPTLATTTESPS
jgi:Flp pilus assembly protein TadD